MPEKAFADTNLFLRYFTNDVPRQANAVETLFRRAAAGELTLVVSQMVIAEIIWTLESFYHLSRLQIRQHLLAILNTPGIEIENETLISQIVDLYAEQNIDFIDAYNILWMQRAGVTTAYTFDTRHFSRVPFIQAKAP
jgi:predicted nucleic-acid-binding protein